jgi:molybdopterin guanine dinucleotide-containing S/N-oxide reductase-like protein
MREKMSEIQQLRKQKSNLAVKDKTVYKSLSQCSFAQGGEVSAVDVKNGKILRIRPHHYEEKYEKEKIAPWKIEKDGITYEAPLKGLIAPYQLAYKKRVYSPNRIQYPLKRVDWDPNGDRNPQNRGKSKFKRISWDEATTIIADEIKRLKNEYGPMAVLCHGDGHGETKTVHGPHGCQMKLMDLMGGYTLAARNADSWEGWYWGTKHVWGDGENGLLLPADNILNDVTQHSQLLIHIGSDLETTPWGFAGQFPSGVLFFWTKIGKKQVFVSPDLNYSGAVHADKWIPILPNTDAALLLAIAYQWMINGTYDKEYVATHVVGFDKFCDYVLGKEDGIEKNAEWASKRCGVAEWTIKGLAREWAKQITSVMHYYGGSYIRGPYSHEPARLEACLLGMQGLGKPGVHQYYKMGGDTRNMIDVPRPLSVGFLESQKMWPGALQYKSVPQTIPKTLVHQAILNPPVSSWGSTLLMEKLEDQFKCFSYPLPKEQGGSEVHMIWMDNPCRTTCWNNSFLSIEAFRSPKIETLVVQHPWMENDTVFADIILPINTKLEEDDFMRLLIGVPLRGMILEDRAIEPIGESKSDYEAVGEVAKKLGVYEQYCDGMTIPEKIKKCYDLSHLQDQISWDEFQEKKYFIIPTDPDWEQVPPGLRQFYENPEKYPLGTPSGKLEFYSQRLADHFPDDTERGPLPKWIEKGPSHDERISSERAKNYPLLMVSNHGRWRTHAQNDDITWTREIYTCKVKAKDGYMYEPVWINPDDAAARGIQNGDIVKIINERGTVLGGALVWERIMQGAVSQDHGARADLIYIDSGNSIDRGGANNLLSPENGSSQNCWGMATSGYLVDVRKVTAEEMAAWRQKYPEVFSRKYDPAAGLCFDAWIEEGDMK